MKLRLSKGYSSRGARMGRHNIIPDELPRLPAHPPRFRMERLRWVDGAYDQGGAYWGMGDSIYCAWIPSPRTEIYVRAQDRQDAIQKVRGVLQDRGSIAEFYR